MRTILIHLNVEVPDDDERSAGAITEAIRGVLEVGSDHESVRSLYWTVALGEEI